MEFKIATSRTEVGSYHKNTHILFNNTFVLMLTGALDCRRQGRVDSFNTTIDVVFVARQY